MNRLCLLFIFQFIRNLVLLTKHDWQPSFQNILRRQPHRARLDRGCGYQRAQDHVQHPRRLDLIQAQSAPLFQRSDGLAYSVLQLFDLALFWRHSNHRVEGKSSTSLFILFLIVRDGQVPEEDLSVFAPLYRASQHLRHLQDAWSRHLVLLLRHPLVGQQTQRLFGKQRLQRRSIALQNDVALEHSHLHLFHCELCVLQAVHA